MAGGSAPAGAGHGKVVVGSKSYRKGRGLNGKDGNGAGKGGAHAHKGAGPEQEGAGPTKLHWRAPRTPALAAHVAHTHPDHVTLTWLRAWEHEPVLRAAGDSDLEGGQVGAGLPGSLGAGESLRGQLTMVSGSCRWSSYWKSAKPMVAQVRGGTQETVQCEALQLPVMLRGGDRRSGGGASAEGGPAHGQEVLPSSCQSKLIIIPNRKSHLSAVTQT